MAARRSQGLICESSCALRRGLFLFTAAAHGRGREPSSSEGEQAEPSVNGDAGGVCNALRTINIRHIIS